MKEEYDFSKAEQGKFYRPIDELEIPVYLEKDVEKFFYQRAVGRNWRQGGGALTAENR